MERSRSETSVVWRANRTQRDDIRCLPRSPLGANQAIISIGNSQIRSESLREETPHEENRWRRERYSLDLSQITHNRAVSPTITPGGGETLFSPPSPSSPITIGGGGGGGAMRSLTSTRSFGRRGSFYGSEDSFSPPVTPLSSPGSVGDLSGRRRHSFNPIPAETDVKHWHVALHELLGEGGSAKVYRASLQGGLMRGMSFAVKEIRMECLDATGQTALKNELNIWRGLQNPHILPLIGVRQVARAGTNVMQCFMPICSSNLAQLLARDLHQRILLPEKQRQIAHDLALALEYCHALLPTPLAHRDIKPENVLLIETNGPYNADGGAQWQVQLADWSEAAHVPLRGTGRAGAFTQANLGSLPYRAPEMCHLQFGGAVQYDHRVDVWSYGGVLLALITGVTPYSDLLDEERRFAAVMAGQRPKALLAVRHSDQAGLLGSECHALAEVAWECFERDPKRRPVMAAIVRRLQPRLHEETAVTPLPLPPLPEIVEKPVDDDNSCPALPPTPSP